MSEFKVGEIVYIKGFDEYGVITQIQSYGDETRCTTKTKNNNEYPILKEMLEHIDNHLPHKQEQEQRIEKLEKEVFKPVEIHDRPKETKPSILTEDERVILRNINKEFKWIIRNEHYLTVTERKPRLDKYGWSVDGGLLADLPFIKLFKFIKFEDDEPYNIEELLKGEMENEKGI